MGTYGAHQCKDCQVKLVPGVNAYSVGSHRCKEHEKAYKRERYASRREELAADQLARYRADPEAFRARMRIYYEGHKDVFLNANAVRKSILETGDDINRRAVWGRDEGHCRIKLVCDGVFVPFAEMELDHVVPLARGGTHTWNNVQTGCRPCNRAKCTNLLACR